MPTMADVSEVSICNLALQDVGRGLIITSLDEHSHAARVCRLRYPFARDACLRAYDWNFAKGRASLATRLGVPSFGYMFAYQLPADCLFVRGIETCADEQWEVEGRKLVTNVHAPLLTQYTRRVVDPSYFDCLFAEALALRMASEIAISLTENVSKAQALWQIYQLKMGEARRRDAQEMGSNRDAVRAADWA